MKNWAIITGMDMIEDAKITGITPAVLTFKGMCEDWPPIILRPCIFFEYCTGMRRSAPFNTRTKTTVATTTARTMMAATVATATDLPAIKRSYSISTSCGRLETILIRSTMEIPLPTPFSVIRSPIHIRRAEPAVIAAITVI